MKKNTKAVRKRLDYTNLLKISIQYNRYNEIWLD